VLAACEFMGIRVLETFEGLRAATSEQAAGSIGVGVSQILKSVLFVSDTAGTNATLVLLSGDRKVDVGKLSRVTGVGMRLARPEEVRLLLGFEVGAVPPVILKGEVRVLLDTSLSRHTVVVASAGTRDSLMKIVTEDLLRAYGAPEDISVATPKG
jgi:prolyl-tRNA editing enzyme YbaK/EbsC (Cys-tRNA(Pro) deacylase)